MYYKKVVFIFKFLWNVLVKDCPFILKSELFIFVFLSKVIWSKKNEPANQSMWKIGSILQVESTINWAFDWTVECTWFLI